MASLAGVPGEALGRTYATRRAGSPRSAAGDWHRWRGRLDTEEPQLEDEYGVGREDARHSADLEEHTPKILPHDDPSLTLPPVLDKLPGCPHVPGEVPTAEVISSMLARVFCLPYSGYGSNNPVWSAATAGKTQWR
jgi:hypothetical protein